MSTEFLSGIGGAAAGVAESVSAPVASVGAVAESAGSVADIGGNLANFGNDMYMPSLNKGLFSNTKVFSQFDPPVSDRLFPSNLLKDTTVLAKPEPISKIAEPISDLKPEFKVE